MGSHAGARLLGRPKESTANGSLYNPRRRLAAPPRPVRWSRTTSRPASTSPTRSMPQPGGPFSMETIAVEALNREMFNSQGTKLVGATSGVILIS
ncbi:hypothetical protein ACP4OV_013525 [Aristida adscensionis]